MPDGEEAMGWWSPNPRGILRPEAVHLSRSLRRSMLRFEFSVDAAFDEVVAACADPSRPHGWIDGGFPDAYRALHDLGWAHSVEVWRSEGLGTRELVGGLFGVQVGDCLLPNPSSIVKLTPRRLQWCSSVGCWTLMARAPGG